MDSEKRINILFLFFIHSSLIRTIISQLSIRNSNSKKAFLAARWEMRFVRVWEKNKCVKYGGEISRKLYSRNRIVTFLQFMIVLYSNVLPKLIPWELYDTLVQSGVNFIKSRYIKLWTLRNPIYPQLKLLNEFISRINFNSVGTTTWTLFSPFNVSLNFTTLFFLI